MKMICTTEIIDPESGEVLQWEGRTLDSHEARWLWELSIEYPMAFTVSTSEQDTITVGMREMSA